VGAICRAGHVRWTMLSRVAHSIYWVGRYLERAENVARIVDVNLNLMPDLAESAREQWTPLVQTSGDAALFAERYETPTRDNVIWFLTFDPANPNSILSCVTAARENARRVREIISSEMWEQINTYFHMARDAARNSENLPTHNEFYARVKLESHLFNGIADAIMSHDEAWHFLRVGSLLERADKTSRILDVKVLHPAARRLGSRRGLRQYPVGGATQISQRQRDVSQALSAIVVRKNRRLPVAGSGLSACRASLCHAG